MPTTIPETPTERAAVVAFWLVMGVPLTTRRIAQITGLSMTGALLLMYRISRVIPIFQDDKGIWQICPENNRASCEP